MREVPILPQLSKKDMKVTTSIRTKLSDLVDDTNDLNNYDTAEKKLRDCRTKYRAYRGEGGSIHQLERQLHELEGEEIRGGTAETAISGNLERSGSS